MYSGDTLGNNNISYSFKQSSLLLVGYDRLPYTEAQLAMRKTLTTKLIRQRTFWGFAGLSWILDKCRLIQYFD